MPREVDEGLTPALSLPRALGAVLVILLALPFVLALFGRPTRRECYRSMGTNTGPFGYFERQVLNTDSDADMVFVGGSRLWAAVDPFVVKDELSHTLRRPADVFTLGFNWMGLDQSYAIIADLLSHRRVRAIVFYLPRLTADDVNEPHVMAYRFLDPPSFGPLLSELPWRHRAELYGEFVLGAPRHLLSVVRPEPEPTRDVEADVLGSNIFQWLFADNAISFPRFDAPVPDIPADEMIESTATANRFEYEGRPLGDYEAFFLRKTLELMQAKGTLAIVLSIPVRAENLLERVHERESWRADYGLTLVGVQPKTLFQGLSEAQVGLLFYDPVHFNDNGRRLFTRTVAPALASVYAQRFK